LAVGGFDVFEQALQAVGGVEQGADDLTGRADLVVTKPIEDFLFAVRQHFERLLPEESGRPFDRVDRTKDLVDQVAVDAPLVRLEGQQFVLDRLQVFLRLDNEFGQQLGIINTHTAGS